MSKIWNRNYYWLPKSYFLEPNTILILCQISFGPFVVRAWMSFSRSLWTKFSERLGVVVWNFDPFSKTFLETFWKTQVSNALWWPVSAKTFKVFSTFCFYSFVCFSFFPYYKLITILVLCFGISLSPFLTQKI